MERQGNRTGLPIVVPVVVRGRSQPQEMAILLSHRSGFAVLRGQISGVARARRHTDLVNGPGTTPPGDNPEEGNENLRGSVKKWSTRFSLDGGGFIRGGGGRATSTSSCVVVAEKHAKVGMKVCGGTRERETFHEPPLIPVSQQRLVDVVLGIWETWRTEFRRRFLLS